jgi:hypothetical protein
MRSLNRTHRRMAFRGWRSRAAAFAIGSILVLLMESVGGHGWVSFGWGSVINGRTPASNTAPSVQGHERIRIA